MATLNFEITLSELLSLDVQKTLDNIRKSAYAIDYAFKKRNLKDDAFNVLRSFGPCLARAEKDLKEAETYIKRG